MKLSIVATMYQSETYIAEFHRRASAVARQFAGEDYEIILVNDGSPDRSLDLAVQLTETDTRVTVIDLARNFGHHKAMMTGLNHASGELVFLLDIDLEEEPEWLPSFTELMGRELCDVVFGVQARRKGDLFERWSGRLFYLLFNLLTGLKLHENIITARLMTQRYVKALLLHREREVFLAGLWHITGFRQRPITVTKHCTSDTTYSLRKKLFLVVNSVTSFSSAPLIGIFYTGLMISAASLINTLYIVANWLFWSKPMGGWTSIITSIWLLGGMIISFIGIVGIYLAKVYSEVKQRPYTIVRQIHGRQ